MSDQMERIVSLTKRRGFVYPSSEIYGGLEATYDYGPLGVELKRLIKADWWENMVRAREDVVGRHDLRVAAGARLPLDPAVGEARIRVHAGRAVPHRWRSCCGSGDANWGTAAGNASAMPRCWVKPACSWAGARSIAGSWIVAARMAPAAPPGSTPPNGSSAG